MSAEYNLSISPGSRFRAQFTAKDTNGNALNISGYNARAYVRNKFSSSGILLDLLPMISGTTAVSGIITVDLSATTTSGVPFGQFVWDLEIFTTEDNAYKLLKGRVVTYPEVSI